MLCMPRGRPPWGEELKHWHFLRGSQCHRAAWIPAALLPMRPTCTGTAPGCWLRNPYSQGMHCLVCLQYWYRGEAEDAVLPARTPAWTAAPRATTSSGFTLTLGLLPAIFCTTSCTISPASLSLSAFRSPTISPRICNMRERQNSAVKSWTLACCMRTEILSLLFCLLAGKQLLVRA